MKNLKLSKNIIILILLCLIGIGTYFFFQSRNNLKDQLQDSENLRMALNDTIRVKENKYGELETEKKTIQTSFNKLKEINGELTENQKNLAERNRKLSNENDLIASALIQSGIKIDSLNNILSDVVVNESDSNIIFIPQNSEFISYKFRVNNVFPSKYGKPTLDILKLQFENEQFIKFQWGDRKEGYPISFSVSNSNPYFKTYDINSYAIPELDKQEIKPNFWHKSWSFMKKNWYDVLIFGAGIGLGSQL